MKVRRILNTGVQEQESEQTVEEEQQLKADSKIRVRRMLQQQQQPTTATDQVAVTEVPEITDELPEGPLSQAELYSYYQEKLPQMFDSEGRLVAPELGRDLGYVFEESLVPTGSRIMGEDVHESTAGTMFRYNQPQAAVEQQQHEEHEIAVREWLIVDVLQQHLHVQCLVALRHLHHDLLRDRRRRSI